MVSTHLQNIRQNWDHVFKDQGEQKKMKPPPSHQQDYSISGSRDPNLNLHFVPGILGDGATQQAGSHKKVS